MTSEVVLDSSGFWYDEGTPVTAVDVLDALRRYRTAEAEAQQRARASLGVGENALLALRHLIRAEREGRTVNAKQLADALGITPASTSALVERLVRSGHVIRHADPTDRRGVILTATGSAMRGALDVLDSVENRTLEAAEQMSQAAAAAFVEFIADMTRAIEGSSDDDDIRSEYGSQSEPSQSGQRERN